MAAEEIIHHFKILCDCCRKKKLTMDDKMRCPADWTTVQIQQAENSQGYFYVNDHTLTICPKCSVDFLAGVRSVIHEKSAWMVKRAGNAYNE